MGREGGEERDVCVISFIATRLKKKSVTFVNSPFAAVNCCNCMYMLVCVGGVIKLEEHVQLFSTANL